MTDYGAIRDWYKDLGKTSKPKTKKPTYTPKRATSQRAAKARAEAQARRAQAEQAARAADQRRRKAQAQQAAQVRAAQAAQAAELQRRAAAEQKRRTIRQRHIVTKTDTPESIAAKYDVEPSAVGRAAGERMRAGQSIEFDRDYKAMMGTSGIPERDVELDAAYDSMMGGGGIPGKDAEFDRDYKVWMGGKDPWLGASDERHRSRAEVIADFARSQRDIARPITATSARLPRPAETSRQAQNRADRYALERGEALTARAEYEIEEKEHREYQVWHEGAKGKYQQAREAWMIGDDALRPDYFTNEELALYSQTVQDRILDELGYRLDLEGKWVPIDILDEDYGMGGYSFPGFGDYGGGGGGGIGGLKDPTGKGSSYGGRKTGGRTRRESKQMFAGNIPRTHWRV